MGKNERLRKEQRELLEMEEKKAIEQRRQERLRPNIAAAKRIAGAVLATILLFYIGSVVNERLPEIVEKISQSAK